MIDRRKRVHGHGLVLENFDTSSLTVLSSAWCTSRVSWNVSVEMEVDYEDFMIKCVVLIKAGRG